MARGERLVDRINNVHEFNNEQLKQCARGVVSMVLTGDLGMRTAQLSMSLLLQEANKRCEDGRRSDLKAGKPVGL